MLNAAEELNQKQTIIVRFGNMDIDSKILDDLTKIAQ